MSFEYKKTMYLLNLNNIDNLQKTGRKSASTFLNVGGSVLLDSPATGPWLIVSETGEVKH